MDEAEIEKKLRGVICDQLGCDEDEVKPESNFIEDLGADSLDVVELVMSIEEEFEIEIQDEDIDKIATVKDAIQALRARLA